MLNNMKSSAVGHVYFECLWHPSDQAFIFRYVSHGYQLENILAHGDLELYVEDVFVRCLLDDMIPESKTHFPRREGESWWKQKHVVIHSIHNMDWTYSRRCQFMIPNFCRKAIASSRSIFRDAGRETLQSISWSLARHLIFTLISGLEPRVWEYERTRRNNQ